MSELSKFINMFIEYGEKIEPLVNKKYKPFIRSVCNLQSLARTVDSQHICLTNEIIIFKLGLEAKSTKSIEVSLLYLQRFFSQKFIDLNVPNYSEEYEIDQTTVKKKEVAYVKNDMRYGIMHMLEPLIHFKSNEINNLLFRVYEHLITEPIAPALIELNLMTPSEIGQKIIYNYFSYRFFIYQQIYTLTEAEFKSINPLSIRNERINQEIQAAFVNHESLLDLVHKYVGEMVAAVSNAGGKYGLCVICREHANYYCKTTKASLCGAQCKKIHIEMAEKQHKEYYQAVNLWKQITVNFELLLETLTKKQSRHLLAVLFQLLEKPHIFMIVKKQFRSLICKYVSPIINCAFKYKDEGAFQIIYNLIASLSRYWMMESMTSLEYFFKESILKVLEDKRPVFKILMNVFKTLAKIFQYGKTLIELYINFDCEFNRINVFERIMFQLSRMCQDKFSSCIYFSKVQKSAIKNSCVTIFSIMAKALNEYRLIYDDTISQQIEEILQLKQKKTNLQKFVKKFNQLWSQGLKALFNLNMVGLESQKEIINLLITTKGLKKQNIQQFLLSENNLNYIDLMLEEILNMNTSINDKSQFEGIIELYRIIPLKKSTVLLKHFQEFFLKKYQLSSKTETEEQIDEKNEPKPNKISTIVNFLNSNYKMNDLKAFIQKQQISINDSLDHVYMKCLQTKPELTLGSHTTYFRYCNSKSYINVFTSQLTLLQIPILYLLQTSYSQEKVFEIITELIQICPSANWIQLCLKNVNSDKLSLGSTSPIPSNSNINSSNNSLTKEDLTLINNCLKLCTQHGQYITEWSGILNFICKMYKVAVSSKNQTKSNNKQEHSSLLTVIEIQEFLLQIGRQSSKKNFSMLVVSILKLAQEEQIVTKGKENVFFLQKSFELIEENIDKFFENHLVILEEMQKMTRSDKPTSAQYSIYLCDMLKQLFVKVLKHSSQQPKRKKANSQSNPIKKQIPQNIKKTVELTFFKIFQSLLKIKIQGNHQVNDLVMDNISVIVMHFYGLHPQTWTFIIERLAKPYLETYRQQCLSILQKIVSEKMSNLQQDLQFDLINICLDLVDKQQTKISIESMHVLNQIVNLLLQKEYQQKLQIEHIMMQENNLSADESSASPKKQKQQQQKQQQTTIKQKTKIVKIEQQCIQQTQQQQQQKLSYLQQQRKRKSSQSQKDINEKQNSQSEQTKIIQQQHQHQHQHHQHQHIQQTFNRKTSSIHGLQTKTKTRRYLMYIMEKLIEFISYDCHEGAIETLFILLKITDPDQSSQQIQPQQSSLNPKQKRRKTQYQKKYLSNQEINKIMEKIFIKLQELPRQLLSRGEKIMNEALFWSVRNKNYGIIKNFEACIIDKYTKLSHTAMKCIKTYISMTNPKEDADWKPIEETLVKVLKNTHLGYLSRHSREQSLNFLQQNTQINQSRSEVQNLTSSQYSWQGEKKFSVNQFSNKLMIQRMTVQVLPNDLKLIDQLINIYQETVNFNDNLQFRCLLWQKGLAIQNTQSPPDILSLEELISYRIISTYYWSKEYNKIANFTLNILEKYCKAAELWQQLQAKHSQMQINSADREFELYMLEKQYWEKRRMPLKVIINYMLPKIPKICKNFDKKQNIVKAIIEGMKFCQERAPYIEAIRQLVMIK